MTTSIAVPSRAQWLFAEGRMADAIRAFDWSATPFGPLHTWPARLRFALDSMLGCAFPATLQWGPDLLLFYNDAYIPLIGDHHPNCLGKPILDSFPEIAEVYRPMADRVFAGERIVLENQLFRYTRHGAPENLWFNLSYSPIHDEDGAVAGLLAIGLNMTPTVLAEQAKSLAETRLRSVLETDAVGVIFFNHSGTMIDANSVFLRMSGYTKEEIASGAVTWRTFTPPEWVPASEEQMQKLAATGRIGPYEKQYMMKDGSRRWMLFAGRDLGDGTIAEYCIDVTDRKRTEEALVRSEKLATLGRMAATIAHEINNPLESTTNLLYLINTSEGLSEKVREHATAAEAELKRVAHITRQSLGFYRESSEFIAASVAECLDDCIDLLRTKITAKKAEIRKDWKGKLILQAVPGELRQLFSNLLANSLDAIKPGGVIYIRAKRSSFAGSATGQGVRVSFADNGLGVDPKLRSKIFDPLFTTKGNYGTGLGLWVTKQIVAKHEGTIRLRSRKSDFGSGTVFSVTLPDQKRREQSTLAS